MGARRPVDGSMMIPAREASPEVDWGVREREEVWELRMEMEEPQEATFRGRT